MNSAMRAGSSTSSAPRYSSASSKWSTRARLVAEEPEVDRRSSEAVGVRTPHVPHVLASRLVARSRGEKEQLSLGGRVLDEADALDPLPRCRPALDFLPPRAGRVVADVLACLPTCPVRALAIGGVTATGLQSPRCALEGLEVSAEGAVVDELRYAVYSLGAKRVSSSRGMRTNYSPSRTFRSSAMSSASMTMQAMAKLPLVPVG